MYETLGWIDMNIGMETHQTEFGQVNISAPYFSFIALRNVRSLTLIKTENNGNGWGVSRELPEGLTITPEFLNMFAKEASELM